MFYSGEICAGIYWIKNTWHLLRQICAQAFNVRMHQNQFKVSLSEHDYEKKNNDSWPNTKDPQSAIRGYTI